MRSPEEINKDYAHLVAEGARTVPASDAPAADWAALSRAQEATHRRRAELIDERLGLVDVWDQLDDYAFRVARDLCRDQADEAAMLAERFEAEAARGAGGGSGE